MKLYKLTDENGQSYNQTQWGENITHTTDGSGELCGPGWLHAYTSPLLAVFLNPIHANFRNPILWEAEGVIEKNDHSLKVGVKSLTTMRQIPLPDVSDEQRIKFGILCAKQVCKDKKWNSWAANWLSGQDRSKAAAYAAYTYAAAVAVAAAYAAYAGAYSAYAAAAATHAAYSATYAASSAAHAAYSATYAAHIPIDLAAIAQCAIQEENKS